jgi:hypothetical protein
MQIARKNYSLPMIVSGYRETEPQINADERRFVDRDFQQQSKNDAKPLSSGLKPLALKHGNETRNSTRMPRIQQIFTDPCKSAQSVKSVFHHADSRTKSTDWKVSASICVHPRFFYDVTFQTGLTGWTGYDCNSVNHWSITLKQLLWYVNNNINK